MKREGRVKKEMYRLFVIGKKSLLEIRKTESRASKRYWERVGEIFEDREEIIKEPTKTIIMIGLRDFVKSFDYNIIE